MGKRKSKVKARAKRFGKRARRLRVRNTQRVAMANDSDIQRMISVGFIKGEGD